MYNNFPTQIILNHTNLKDYFTRSNVEWKYNENEKYEMSRDTSIPGGVAILNNTPINLAIYEELYNHKNGRNDINIKELLPGSRLVTTTDSYINLLQDTKLDSLFYMLPIYQPVIERPIKPVNYDILNESVFNNWGKDESEISNEDKVNINLMRKYWEEDGKQRELANTIKEDKDSYFEIPCVLIDSKTYNRIKLYSDTLMRKCINAAKETEHNYSIEYQHALNSKYYSMYANPENNSELNSFFKYISIENSLIKLIKEKTNYQIYFKGYVIIIQNFSNQKLYLLTRKGITGMQVEFKSIIINPSTLIAINNIELPDWTNPLEGDIKDYISLFDKTEINYGILFPIP